MSIPPVTIIDYQLGNLFSVRKACEMLGCPVAVSSDRKDLEAAGAVILPGVGAFGQAMENLHQLDLVQPLLDHVAAGKPLFGICLGLQLLFEESAEFGSPKGLGILRGSVRKLPVTDAPVPQIGWNRIDPGPARPDAWQGTPLQDVPPSSWMYFVHSFYVDNADPEDALCATDYAGFQYTSAALKGSVFATQVHPEKSAHEGLQIYRHWLSSLPLS
jgi:glutamine amidotransferase